MNQFQLKNILNKTKWKQVTTEEIKDNKQHSERIKWKKVKQRIN